MSLNNKQYSKTLYKHKHYRGIDYILSIKTNIYEIPFKETYEVSISSTGLNIIQETKVDSILDVPKTLVYYNDNFRQSVDRLLGNSNKLNAIINDL